MTDTPRDLDVVVLGGGGHVGLPLSLAFAKAGLRVGHLRHEPGDPRPHRGRRDAVPGDRRRRAAREILPTGRLAFGSDGSMIERTDQLVVVIGTPVDEFLAPSMTIFEKAVDQIAPHLRDGALVVLRSTVYPGTTEYVTQHLAERGAHASTWRSAPSGSPRATRSRSSTRCPRSSAPTTTSRPSAPRRCSASSRRRPSGRRPRRPSSRSSSRTRGGT